jgi:2-polyprenyl-6-methoxyphenol hydroxylase-like FAD-dependent oxidoreductase
MVAPETRYPHAAKMSAVPSPSPPGSSPAGRDAPPVVIVGAGPVGLALALGLDRHGVRSVVLERGTSTSEHSKAAVIHVRTREVLRQWHVEEPFLAAGTLRSSLTLHAAADDRPLVTFDLAELRSDAEDPGLLLLEQSETERLLLAELQRSEHCEVRFATTFVRLDQHETHVAVTVSTDRGEQRLDAAFLVACDGASSTVRDAIGMPFHGVTYGVRPMLADVRVEGRRDDLPWPRQRQGPSGITNAIRIRPGLWRIIRLDDGGRDERHDDDPAVADDEVQRRVAEVLGSGAVEVVWAERFRIHRRSSPRFRVGRVVLAGDAAHIHSPLGGLGMNAGIQDAHNLAWKLAAALQGGDVDRLLDSYDVERRAVVVEQVSRTTDRATRVFLQAPTQAREHSVRVLSWLLAVAPIRRRGLRTLAMIDLDYPGSPLLDPSDRSAGTRLPDPVLLDPDGREVRLHRLLPGAAPLLLEVATTGQRTDDPAQADPTAASAAERPVATLRIGPGGHLDDRQVLRGLLGGHDGWILVRADGHLAWAQAGHDRPDDGRIAWSLGADVRRPRRTRQAPRSRTILDRARAFRDRTTLDLPHYR